MRPGRLCSEFLRNTRDGWTGLGCESKRVSSRGDAAQKRRAEAALRSKNLGRQRIRGASMKLRIVTLLFLAALSCSATTIIYLGPLGPYGPVNLLIDDVHVLGTCINRELPVTATWQADLLTISDIPASEQKLLGVGVSEQGVHWAPVPGKDGWHSPCHDQNLKAKSPETCRPRPL